jgi:hypothetical protein
MSINHVFHSRTRSVVWLGVVFALVGSVAAQAELTTPEKFFGHEIGTDLGRKLELPVSDALVEFDEEGKQKRLDRDKYYLPGSVLRSRVDNTSLIAHGMSQEVDVFFNNNPVFRLGPDAAMKGVRPVAWFDSPTTLSSGWAWGQEYLEGAVSVVSAEIGDGHLYLFGPEITFRAQPHGTFKLLFNGLALSSVEER